MGQLYVALSGTPGLEKLCVIKQVPPDIVAPENARRFRDEAMVALRLAHGNLVSVFDAGVHGGQLYLAMELVDGRDLHAVWNRCADRRVAFPLDVSVYIIKELVRGLAYAHAFENLSLVHRDVSPANVMLSFTGEVKLTDFGLATSVLKLERTMPGIIYGKLSYLAPEQARREKLDGRSDIYAAGILLWELLTGQQLFPVGQAKGTPSQARGSALERARDPHVPPPSALVKRVPAALDKIVMRALAPEREDRYANGEDMRADLAAFLAETSPTTDAARLAEFLAPLFGDEARADRLDRQKLTDDATRLLSGAIDPSASPLVADFVAQRASMSPPPFLPRPPDALGVLERLPPGVFGGRPPESVLGAAATISEPAQTVVSPQPGQDPRIGTTVGGRYFVRRLCGEGAMGRVYEAHHIDIGRRVAIKVLHSSYHHNADLVERFRREARAASKIGHENIVDVTDSGTTPDGAFYFVMEFIDGVNLEELIAKEGALPPERALLITAQITRALEAAHAADVIHRDLKPANVMLVNRREKPDEDFVKVLDFGISKDLRKASGVGDPALTNPNVAIGTPVYMAPEQAAGKAADAAADIYAVGGLLYEMLTGAQPYRGDDAIEVLHKKANEEPRPVGELRPDLPADVQRLVTRALARQPSDRHPSMAALKLEVLASLSAPASAPIPEPPALARLGSGARKTPTAKIMRAALNRRTAVAAVALAAAAAGAAFVMWTRPRDAGDTAAAARAPSPPASAIAVAQPPADPDPPPPTRVSAPASDPQPSSPEPSQRVAAPVPRVAPAPQARSVTVASKRRDGARARATPTAIATTTPAGSGAPDRPLPGPSPEAVLSRGQAAFDRGDFPEAIRRGREAITGGAALAGHLLVGDAYFRVERFADALREYDAALAADPTSAVARRRRDMAQPHVAASQ
jgi:serine/threonine-protein kinase